MTRTIPDSRVAVQCPECRRGFVVNRRGRCRCGAYLVARLQGPSFWFTSSERMWLRIDGAWMRWSDVHIPTTKKTRVERVERP